MLKPVSVLILDDEPNILTSLRRLLADQPYNLAVTMHPFEAMAILSREPVKVVITDQRMPVVSGVQFLQEILAVYPDVIRILLTGHADLTAAQEAVNIGQVYRFLSKPWDCEGLKQTIADALQEYDRRLASSKSVECFEKKQQALLSINAELNGILQEHRELCHSAFSDIGMVKTAINRVSYSSEGFMSPEQLDEISTVRTTVDHLEQVVEKMYHNGKSQKSEDRYGRSGTS